MRYGAEAATDPLLRWMLSAYAEFSTGGPLDAISALIWDEDDGFAGADVILPAGYDRILPCLADGLDIRLGQTVHAVRQYAQAVTVTTSEGRFEADALVCTLPLGVLKAGAVTFDPPLPTAHQRAVDVLGLGQVTKLALRFDRPFWPADLQYIGVMTQPLGRWNYLVNALTYSDVPLLLAVSLGSYAPLTDRMSDEEAIDDMMQVLRAAFGQATPAPTGALKTAWSRNPLSGGAYSFAQVGSAPRDFDRFAEPFGRVHFAGEHTGFDYHGTVHGAHLSGLRAAEAILR